MTTANDARRAHELLDELDARAELSQEQEKLLRSFLPELPKQKTLTELRHEVNDAWAGTNDNEWPDDMHCDLETWLYELHAQLKGLKGTPAAVPVGLAPPEFLETEADYENAPEGTIVASSGRFPWVKGAASGWACSSSANSDFAMSKIGRRNVLRWGWGE